MKTSMVSQSYREKIATKQPLETCPVHCITQKASDDMAKSRKRQVKESELELVFLIENQMLSPYLSISNTMKLQG
ncbi:hypothetical protein Tco_0692523 [Tanacetum coccineum]